MTITLAMASGSVLVPHDATAATPATCPPGPSKPAPAGCPPPQDLQCADATGPYAPSKNPTCAAAWSDHCACVNTNQFNAARAAVATPANTERVSSPTKGVYLADATKNSVHVGNYGIKTTWLKGAPPLATAARVNDTLGGGKIIAKNVTDPPTVAVETHKPYGNKSQATGRAPVNKRPKAIPASKQNIWAAHETYARAEAQDKCANKTGADLLACAKAYYRPALHSASGKLNDPVCESFVYNRYSDIEEYTDHMNACHGDPLCRAAIVLDPTVGVAGRPLTGSDVSAANHANLKKFFDAFESKPMPADCAKATGEDLQLCELANSLPPIAFVRPTYFAPLSGLGTASNYVTSSGAMMSGFGLGMNNQTPVGYWASKNPFYDAAAQITAMVAQSFASDPTKYQSILRLQQEVKKGHQYYYLGKYFNGKAPSGGQTKSYSSEFEFDRAMHGQVSDRPMRAFRDFAKRKEFLQQREDTFSKLYWAAAPQPHFKIPGTLFPDLTAGAAVGGEEVALGPMQSKPTAMGAAPMVKSAKNNLSEVSLQIAQPSDLDRQAWGPSGKAPPMDPAYKYPRLQCTAPDILSTGFSAVQRGVNGLPVATPINGPAINHKPTAADISLAACNMVNAILDEWARADSPKILAPNDVSPPPAPTGCFANDVACDWEPVSFVHGVEELVHTQISNVQYAKREADFKFCKAWEPVIRNEKKYADQRNGELIMLGEMKNEVQTLYAQLSDVPVLDHGGEWISDAKPGTAWASSLPMKPEKGDSFATFGEDRHNAEVWGNDMFGAGYSYDIGWEIPVRWEQTQPASAFKVCDFGIGAHGGFEAYAFAFGSDKFDIIDADLVAGVHDYTNPQVPGASADVDTNLHEAAFDEHLTIAGESVIPAEDAKVRLNQTIQGPSAFGSNSWNLFTIPFQISFVTLEMSVGVGYSYNMVSSITPGHANVCHDGKKNTTGYPWPPTAPTPSQPSLSLTSLMDPSAELDGIVDAYASIAGLAGVGVDVNITLLGLGLPVENVISLDPNNLSVKSSLNMDFRTLDGSLSVYAELLFITLFDVEIMSWDGFHSRVPLFNTSTKVPMPALSLLGKTGLANPAKSLMDL